MSSRHECTSKRRLRLPNSRRSRGLGPHRDRLRVRPARTVAGNCLRRLRDRSAHRRHREPDMAATPRRGGQATPDGPLTPEIQDLFMNRRTLSVLAIDIAWFFVIIFDMVIKSFSSSSRSSVAPTQWFPVGNESHRHQGSSASSDGAARPKARSVRPPIQSATSSTYICGASNGSR